MSAVPIKGRKKSPDWLNSVAAISANDVWAVGDFNITGPHGGYNRALVEHWNGTAWSIVPDASPKSGFYDLLSAISVVSKNNIWAVGNEQSGALIVHWNGTAWKTVSSPPEPNGELSGVTEIPGTAQLWAVGTTDINTPNGKTLTEFYC